MEGAGYKLVCVFNSSFQSTRWCHAQTHLLATNSHTLGDVAFSRLKGWNDHQLVRLCQSFHLSIPAATQQSEFSSRDITVRGTTTPCDDSQAGVQPLPVMTHSQGYNHYLDVVTQCDEHMRCPWWHNNMNCQICSTQKTGLI